MRFGSPRTIATSDGSVQSVHAANLDSEGDLEVIAASQNRIVWYEVVYPRAGDANRDWMFDQEDVAQILQAAKYLTGEPASWEEGDWNADSVFDQSDIVAALQTGNYQSAPIYSKSSG